MRYDVNDAEKQMRAVGEALLCAWGRWARSGDEAKRIGRTDSVLRLMLKKARRGSLLAEQDGGEGLLKLALDDVAPAVDAILTRMDNPRRRALAVIVYQRGYRGTAARDRLEAGTGHVLSPKGYRCALERLREAVYWGVEGGEGAASTVIIDNNCKKN